MPKDTGVRDVSPRVHARQRSAAEVRYPVPCPPPTDEDCAQVVKDCASMLPRLSGVLKGYSPGDCDAGRSLVAEARGHLDAAGELLAAIARENARGGKGLHRLSMRRLAQQDRRHREHIRTDVHDVLADICRAVEARMLAERSGTRKGGKGDVLRMMRNAESRLAG